MKDKFKASGVAMICTFALSATLASGAHANFTSENYPASVTGASTDDVLHMFGSSVGCQSHFAGSLSGPTDELALITDLTNCTFFGFPTTIDFTSCDYLLKTTTASNTPEFDIQCANPGDTIDITIFASHAAHTAGTPICHIDIPEQEDLHGMAYTSNPDGTLTISGNIGGITAIEHRTSFVCPGGTTTEVISHSVEYTLQSGGIVLSGDNGGISVH